MIRDSVPVVVLEDAATLHVVSLLCIPTFIATIVMRVSLGVEGLNNCFKAVLIVLHQIRIPVGLM